MAETEAAVLFPTKINLTSSSPCIQRIQTEIAENKQSSTCSITKSADSSTEFGSAFEISVAIHEHLQDRGVNSADELQIGSCGFHSDRPPVRSECYSTISDTLLHGACKFFEQVEAVLRTRTRLRMELNGKHRPVEHPDPAIRSVEQ